MIHYLYKYKIYHIPFWIVYHLTWLVINTDSLENSWDYLFGGELPVKFIGYVIFQAAGAYFNLYYLIPKYLSIGRFSLYILLLLLTILTCSGLIVCGYYINSIQSSMTFIEMSGRSASEFMYIFSRQALPSTAASMTLAMSVKLAKNWINTEREKLLLQKENLETELKYLKSQINPHFLFNTINSIYVLIHKNPDLASESLATFSDMLRYQLYECNESYIPIKKELDFINDFIDLESLRLDLELTQLTFDINHQENQSEKIAPFIILPFVENAFKHLSKEKNKVNFIRMKLSISEKHVLDLEIENSKGECKQEISSGIGLNNVKRRLNLLYPDQHNLLISEHQEIFHVKLKLDLG